MDGMNEDFDFSAFTCDEETLKLFDSFAQELPVSAQRSISNVMDDQIFPNDFHSAPDGAQPTPEQMDLLADTLQTSSTPMVGLRNEQQNEW